MEQEGYVHRATRLMEAALSQEGTAADVEQLLAEGEDVNLRLTDNGYTALHAAAMAECDAEEDGRMRLLLAAGADTEASVWMPTGGPWTPLMLAAFEGRAGQVRLLLTYGAAKDVQDSQGRTALMLSAWSSYDPLAKVRVLVEAGANPLLRSAEGKTAADYAVWALGLERQWAESSDKPSESMVQEQEQIVEVLRAAEAKWYTR